MARTSHAMMSDPQATSLASRRHSDILTCHAPYHVLWPRNFDILLHSTKRQLQQCHTLLCSLILAFKHVHCHNLNYSLFNLFLKIRKYLRVYA